MRDARENERDDARMGEHASRASALLAARANAVKEANAKPSVKEAGALSAAQERMQSQRRPETLVEFAKRNAVYIAAVVAVVLVVAIGVIVLGAVMPETSHLDDVAEEEPSYVSPYDWTKLDRAGGRYRYIDNGEVKSRLGIDVSENQHEIDWEAVAADGIDYAIVRVGYRGATAGDLYLDGYYWDNMTGARNAGLDVGAYFFSQACSVQEALEEADFVLEKLDGIPLQYPIAFDSETVALDSGESRTTKVGTDEMTAIAEAFCKRVEDAGYQSVVYGNAVDLSRYRYGNLEQRSIWWAEYGTPVPTANIDLGYWQYSNSGEVAGIPVAVDMNIDLTRVL